MSRYNFFTTFCVLIIAYTERFVNPRPTVSIHLKHLNAVFPLEMGIYSKMCGAYIIHQNPVIVNMDFGISPRESERERHYKNFGSGYFGECKIPPLSTVPKRTF